MVLHSRTPRSLVSRCRAVVLHFENQNTSTEEPMGDLAVSTVVDLKGDDDDILSFQFQKNNTMAAGVFSITLSPRRNYKEVIKPGDWILIYMSHEGVAKESLRVIGNVDRVSVTEDIDDNTRSITYVISGRDHGKVFEKTEIWFNPYIAETLAAEGYLTDTAKLDLADTPSNLILAFIKLFLGDNGSGALSGELVSLSNQWIMPDKISSYLNMGGARFVDFLQQNIQTISNGEKVVNFLEMSGSNLWSVLKSYSNAPLNEIYVEIDDSGEFEKPAIFFRMVPFANKNFTDSTGIIQGEINYFADLPEVKITGEDIWHTDIGLADYDRFNFFLLLPTSDLFSADSSIEYLKPDFPKLLKNSIKRYGLSLLLTNVDYSFQNADEGSVYEDLLRAWNDFMYQLHKDNHHYENGSVTIVAKNETRIGKRLVISDARTHNKKQFYIEGYTDTWNYPGAWEQTLELTRGQIIQDGNEELVKDVETTSDIFTGQSVIKGVRR